MNTDEHRFRTSEAEPLLWTNLVRRTSRRDTGIHPIRPVHPCSSVFIRGFNSQESPDRELRHGAAIPRVIVELYVVATLVLLLWLLMISADAAGVLR
jgi:hypothetical protein